MKDKLRLAKEWNEMPPRERDAWLAEHTRQTVAGIRVEPCLTDIIPAMWLVADMRSRGYSVSISFYADWEPDYVAGRFEVVIYPQDDLSIVCQSDNLPSAIAEAVFYALGGT